jgi:hypothetical protein
VFVVVDAKGLAAHRQLAEQPRDVCQLVRTAVKDGNGTLDLCDGKRLWEKRPVALFCKVLIVVVRLEAITRYNLKPVLEKRGRASGFVQTDHNRFGALSNHCSYGHKRTTTSLTLVSANKWA